MLIFHADITKKIIFFSLFTPRFSIRKFITVVELSLRRGRGRGLVVVVGGGQGKGGQGGSIRN